MYHPRPRPVIVLILGCALALAACAGPQTTLAPTAPPLVTPPAYVSPTPDLIPDLSCAQDSDCALARSIDGCCGCGAIFNREQVENEPRLRYLFEPEGYRYERGRRLQWPWECANIMCAPCPEPPFGLVCDSGACRGAQTWQEILAACPSLPPSRPMDWCYTSAALTAKQSGELEQAMRICEQYSSDKPRCKQFVSESTPSP